MMVQSHLAPLEGSHHHTHPHPHPEVIQQPRRFACDRCRMQKLRCERDIWRPSLMPCKRCRKARMACTISSMDRPVSKKKSKDRVLTITRPEKITTGQQQTQRAQRKSPHLDVSQHSPNDPQAGFYDEALSEGFNIIGGTGLVSDGVQPEECYTSNGGFEEYPGPAFSGLITPPSMDSEREHQMPLQTTSFMISQQQEWTPVSNTKGSDGFEYDDPFPCLDDREQWWDQENLRRLLDMNMHLLECQSLVAQDLTMLGNMDAHVALNNLDLTSQNVLRYSQQFLDVVKVFVEGGYPTMATVSIAGPMAANTFTSQIQTPAQSRRPSHNQQTTASTVESTLAPGSEASMPSHIGPAATYNSSFSSQSSWQGGQFEDVQVSLILATINCYTCLVGSYHIVLSYLLHELMAVSTPEQNQQTSPTISGFAAAFAATAHVQQPNRDAQLRLIFQNCMRMLAQLEISLGIPEQHCVASWALPFLGAGQHHRQNGILSTPMASILLSTLVSQKFGLCVNGLASAKNSMKEIISTINQFFDAAQSARQVVSTIQ